MENVMLALAQINRGNIFESNISLWCDIYTHHQHQQQMDNRRVEDKT